MAGVTTVPSACAAAGMYAPVQHDPSRAAAAAFARFDSGAKGYLTRHELRCAHIALLGHALSLTELDSLVPKRSGSGAMPSGLTLPQLIDLVTRKLALQEPEELVRRAFRAFDQRANGYVSLADLEAAVQRVAPQLPRHTVALAFAQLDADCDGRVAYRDFLQMMLARPAGRESVIQPMQRPSAGRQYAAVEAM